MSSSTLEALAAEAPGPDGHRQIVRLAVNAVAAARGLPQPWPIRLPDGTAQRVSKLLADLGGLSHWGAAELGALRTTPGHRGPQRVRSLVHAAGSGKTSGARGPERDH